MKRKFWIIVLAIAGALCLALGLAACGGGGPKEKKVNLGDSPEQVVKLLGEPYEEESSETHYVYLGSNYLSLLKRSAELEERMLNVKNEKEFEKIFQEMAKLETTLASLVYTRTEITFSRNEEGQLAVSEVWYDAAHSEAAPEKTLVGSMVEGAERHTYEEVMQGTIKGLAVVDRYSDGSYRKSMGGDGKLNFSISGKQVTWKWKDANEEHTSASTLKKVIPNGLGAEGIYGIEAVYVIPEGAQFYDPEGANYVSAESLPYCTWLTSLKIPESFREFPNYVLSECPIQTAIVPLRFFGSIPRDSLKKVVFTSADSLGPDTFRDCTSLETIEVAEEVEDYSSPDGILYDKEKTEVIVVPQSFKGVVTIPEGVTSIGSSAFYGCTSLTSISIPSSMTSIEEGAFSGCDSLAKIEVEQGNEKYHASGNCIVETATKTLIVGCKSSVIPKDESVTNIGSYSFYNCGSLESILIPEGVTSIGWRAFNGCTSLESIIISDSVTSIEGGAFSGCTSLTSVNFGESSLLESIGREAFYDCTSLTSVNFGESSLLKSIGWSAFNGCASLENITIPDSVTSIEGGAFSGCTSLTSVNFGESSLLKSIDKEAFNGCTSLESITIPDSVTSIEEGAFSGCDSLAKIEVEQGNEKYHASGNCIIETATKTLIVGCKSSVIPKDQSVTSIGDGAFYGCHSLEYIVIPEGMTSIGEDAFCSCTSLESITIPDSVTSIEGYAFRDCTSLTSVNFGESSLLESIDNGMFYGCTSLESITIPEDVTSIGKYAFENCKSLTSIIIPDSVTSIEDEAFIYCHGLTSIEIPDSVTSIGDRAFEYCSGLESVTIGSGVTSIGQRAFYECRSLESITIPNSVTSIGADAFCNCSVLTSVTIGSGVTSIGDSAFWNCVRLKTVYYQGTAKEWNISIDDNNDLLTSATRYYFTEEAPTAEQWAEWNYWWHFDETTGEVVEWVKP